MIESIVGKYVDRRMKDLPEVKTVEKAWRR